MSTSMGQPVGLSAQVSFWKEQIASGPDPFELPTDEPRLPAPSFFKERAVLRLSSARWASVSALAADTGTDAFSIVFGAFALVASRHTEQADLWLGTGTPTHNGDGRTTPNLLAIRLRIPGDATVDAFLSHVQSTLATAAAHRDIPFAEVQNMAGEQPLFRALLLPSGVQAEVWPEPTAPDLRALGVEAALCDLILRVAAVGDGTELQVEYDPELFHDRTIERLLEQVDIALAGMAAGVDTHLSTVALVTEAERRRLLFDWNDTAHDYPHEALTQSLFEAQAARGPERTALVAEASALSYGELEARANRLARALRARGVGRGQRVGVCVERGTQTLTAVLGILKAGAAYVPLDPAFPRERLRFMAQDAQLSLLVSTGELAEALTLAREHQLLLDVDAASIDSQSDQPLTPDASLDAHCEDPAYVIYTSGSTGKPKGVVVPHRAVVNFLASMAREPGLSADDVLVAVTTLSFDISVLELLLPLMVGATVVIANRAEAMDGQALKHLLQTHNATVMQATPVTWRFSLEAGWRPERGFKALVGGEALPRDLADELLGHGVELWNLYGPTETTVWSTCAHITDTAEGISIGRPIANTTVYVLDEHRNLCPIGVAGELYIGGDGVTLGYWERPELTAERFVADPFSATPGATLYRTGDRARWRSDGTLEHLGRLDFQIKLRGFRIEAGEIEASIVRHPAVRDAVVIAREDVPGNPRLVAYFVAERSSEVVDQLRTRLRENLPEYMVPTHFVALQALPRTPNGKLDRKALPAPVISRGSNGRPYAAPRTKTENAIARIWATVLGMEKIGINENFFDLGGHSLLLLQAHSELRTSLRADLPFVALMQYPTISSLASYLSGTAEQSVVPTAAADRARRRRHAMQQQRSVREEL